MNKETILSICIPTYNRAYYLNQILEIMCPICLENAVLIYISDNASTDNTKEIVEKYVQQYSVVYYHRHDTNIGPDDNFEYVLKMPDSKYRWLMSDTCYIDDVKAVLDDLSKTEYDGYILNGGDGTRHLYLPNQKKIYANSIDLMKEIGWHLTWISCMIYNEWMINTMDFERYRKSCFNQTALMFEPLANKKCQVCFNSNFRVKNLTVQKESGWLYHVFDVMYRQWALLIMSLPIYYPYEVKKKCICDTANKSALLGTYFHMCRRGDGKWRLSDVYKNRFFIKFSNDNYYILLILGILPRFVSKWIVGVIDCFLNILKKNDSIRLIGKKFLNLYLSKK